MRLFMALVMAAFPAFLSAVEVVKVDGEVLQGSIEEIHLDESLRIRTADKRLFEVEWAEIRSIDGKVIHAPPKPERPFWAKGWYLDLIELGVAAGSYPTSMESKLNAASGLPGVSTGRVDVNMLGLYWPVGAKRDLLLGGMMESTGHIVSQGNQSWSLDRELYAFSTLYFPFGRIGDNFFLRGDIGLVDARYASPEFAQAQNGTGVGFKVGIGYAVPLGRFVRPLLNFGYGLQTIGDGDPGMDLGVYQGIDFDVGVLW